ncbi:B2 bradykinin receptor-like [Plectropomus leopardus]|uniref:B2 bradykinin receptor-like n=1 Tax=Plectropomus leopardus TaxID=160734 RepID=UPI001C4BDD86|nr:B2 bradykinin receptor-like [Plectropomus leopardus]
MTSLPTGFPIKFTTDALYGGENNTNATRCKAELSEWHSTVLPVYILVISVLGIVLNAFVLMVFCLHKKACNVPEIYLSNLAAADLILMICLPFWAKYAANKFSWPFDLPLCRLVTLSINMNAYCSIYFLVLISVDRCLALVHPLSHDRLRRPKYAKMGCVLVWGFGFLLGVPTLVYRDVKEQSKSKVCFLNYPNSTARIVSNGMLMTFGFIIPISIISYCTFKIIQALNDRPMEAVSTEKTERKATTLVLAVLIAFLICWLPFHLLKIPKALQVAKVLRGCGAIAIINTCGHVFMYLAFFNSVLNPILYVIVGENFRKKIRELCKQWQNNRSLTRNTYYTRSHLSRSNTSRHS